MESGKLIIYDCGCNMINQMLLSGRERVAGNAVDSVMRRLKAAERRLL